MLVRVLIGYRHVTTKERTTEDMIQRRQEPLIFHRHLLVKMDDFFALGQRVWRLSQAVQREKRQSSIDILVVHVVDASGGHLVRVDNNRKELVATRGFYCTAILVLARNEVIEWSVDPRNTLHSLEFPHGLNALGRMLGGRRKECALRLAHLLLEISLPRIENRLFLPRLLAIILQLCSLIAHLDQLTLKLSDHFVAVFIFTDLILDIVRRSLDKLFESINLRLGMFDEFCLASGEIMQGLDFVIKKLVSLLHCAKLGRAGLFAEQIVPLALGNLVVFGHLRCV
mmetsp:Transcript_30148/g.79164  ORF Transcript_30148/g.79164 Transcript_30148/m.79164 type:complete len:284 (+) Transcript_30148:1838-2689(+)